MNGLGLGISAFELVLERIEVPSSSRCLRALSPGFMDHRGPSGSHSSRDPTGSGTPPPHRAGGSFVVQNVKNAIGQYGGASLKMRRIHSCRARWYASRLEGASTLKAPPGPSNEATKLPEGSRATEGAPHRSQARVIFSANWFR